jgi:hypothetical protein
LKWLVICTLCGRLLWVSKAYSGRIHDFALFKDLFAGLTLENYRVHVDAGFVGLQQFIACKHVFIPFKARPKQPLTPLQLSLNQLLASLRVVVENVLARLKSFFILRITNRMRKKEKLDDAVALCADLIRFKHIASNNLTFSK